MERDGLSRTTALPEPLEPEEIEIAQKDTTTFEGEEEAEEGSQPVKSRKRRKRNIGVKVANKKVTIHEKEKANQPKPTKARRVNEQFHQMRSQ